MKQMVGSIVESICGKCNDVMGHTIMAMVGSDIIKVECRVCKSQHKYRPPTRTAGGKSTVTMKRGRDGEPASSRQSAISDASRPLAPKPKKKSTAQLAAQESFESWQAAMRQNEEATPRPYAMSAQFAPGELIQHPTFGIGFVKGTIPPDKMDVLFEVGLKRLLCNKG